MAVSLGSLLIDIGMRTASLNNDLNKVGRSIDRNSRKWERRFQGVSKAFGGIFAGLSVAGLASATREVTRFADTLANTADRVGVSVESVQALRLEAEKVGLSFSQTDTALQRFSRRIAEAQQGTGQLGKVFKQYGVALKDSAGNFKDVNALLEEFRTVLSGIESPAERNRVAMAAFDTEGVKLGQTLHGLNGTIEETREALIAQGRVMREDGVRAAAELERKWTEMSQRITAKMQRMVIAVISGVEEIWNSVKSLEDFGSSSSIYALESELGSLQERLSSLQQDQSSSRLDIADAIGLGTRSKVDEQVRETINKIVELTTKINALRASSAKPVDLEVSGGAAQAVTDLNFASDKALKGWSKTDKKLRREIERLSRDMSKAGIDLTITSTFREGAGGSQHNHGNAIDLVASNFERARDWWRANSHKYALAFPVKDEGPENWAGTTFGTGAHWHAQMEKNATAARSASVATRGLSDAERQLQQLQSEGARIFEQTRTAAEAHVLNMNRLQQLYSAGAISLNTYNRAVAQSGETLGKVDDVQKKTAESVDNLWQQAGDSVASALSRMVEGTAKARDVIKNLVADIANMLAKQAIAKYIGGALGGGVAAAHGLAFPGGMSLGQGVYNSPHLFKFARGGRLGLLGEAGAEAVLPLTRLSGGDLGVKAQAARQEVIINNYSGAPARETRRQLSDREIVEITIGEVQSAIGRGGNALSRSFETSYGLRRGR